MATPITKRAAALASICSGVLLTALKLAVGIATGSLAILAEAAHSALDLLAAGITFLVVQIADLPPDENHPYGHARAEHLGALAEAVLLVVTAVLVLRESYLRIFVHAELPEISIWAFAVMIVSLVVDWRRSRSLEARGRASSRARRWQPTRRTSPTTALDRRRAGRPGAACARSSRGALLPAWLLHARRCAGGGGRRADRAVGFLGHGPHAIRALMDDVPADLSRRLVRQVTALPSVVPDSVQMRTRFVGQQPYVEVTLGTPRGGSLEAGPPADRDGRGGDPRGAGRRKCAGACRAGAHRHRALRHRRLRRRATGWGCTSITWISTSWPTRCGSIWIWSCRPT